MKDGETRLRFCSTQTQTAHEPKDQSQLLRINTKCALRNKEVKTNVNQGAPRWLSWLIGWLLVLVKVIISGSWD